MYWHACAEWNWDHKALGEKNPAGCFSLAVRRVAVVKGTTVSVYSTLSNQWKKQLRPECHFQEEFLTILITMFARTFKGILPFKTNQHTSRFQHKHSKGSCSLLRWVKINMSCIKNMQTQTECSENTSFNFNFQKKPSRHESIWMRNAKLKWFLPKSWKINKLKVTESNNAQTKTSR